MRVVHVRRSVRAALATMLVGGVGYLAVGAFPTAVSATPANPNNYNISAEGDAINIVVQNASVPLFPTLSLSPWGSSAALDSVGTSTAAAGAPYSPQVFTLPGTVNGLGAGGLLPPVPPLPGYVSSNYPAKAKDVQTQGGVFAISALSDENQSEGKIGMGVTMAGSDDPQVFSDSKVIANKDGSVSASASAGADLLNLGGLADIGNISTKSTLTLQAGKKPVVTSTVNLGSVTLLGNLTTGLGLGGLKLPLVGSAIPITTTLIPTLNTVLKPAGISLTYAPVTYTYTDGTSTTDKVDASKTVQGVDTGGLSIATTRDVKGLGPTTVTSTIGRTFLSATNMPGFVYTPPPAIPVPPAPASSSQAAVVPPPAAPEEPAPPVEQPADTGGSVDVPVADAPQADVPVSDASVPVDTGQQPQVPVDTGQQQQPAPQQQQLASSPVDALRTTGAQGMFLILFLAGLVMLGGSQFVRLLAVKLAM